MVVNFKWQLWKKKETGHIGEIGTSVIDYVIPNIEVREKIKKVIEETRTESAYISMEVKLLDVKLLEREKRKRKNRRELEEIEKSIYIVRERTSIIETTKDRCVHKQRVKKRKELKNKVQQQSIIKLKKKIAP